MDLLNLESAVALQNFLDNRQDVVRICMRRGPESFIGEYHFHYFVSRVFGRHAAIATFYFTLSFPVVGIFLWTTMIKSDFIIIFLLLSFSTWLIFAGTWILAYHFQLSNAVFYFSRESAIYSFAEHSEEIRLALQERNSSESVNVVIRRMLTRHAFHMYFIVISWFTVNFILLMPIIERLSLKPKLVVFLCWICVLRFLVRQSAKVYRRM